MKRKYIAPATKITAINPTCLICASVNFGTGNTSSMDVKEELDFDMNDILNEMNSEW